MEPLKASKYAAQRFRESILKQGRTMNGKTRKQENDHNHNCN